MVGTWAYHLYDKSHYVNNLSHSGAGGKDTTAMAEAIRDSLKQIYAATLSGIKEISDSSHPAFDSLKTQLDNRMAEINKLRNEITAILSNKKISRAELIEAKNKIIELRTKIEEMQVKNSTLENQQQKLTDQLKELNDQMKNLESNLTDLGTENKALKDKINDASTLNASEIRLAFMDVRESGNAEVETSKARKANKIVVSFIVQNNIAEFTNTELVVVLTNPDGHVITNEVWESGNFQTKKEGTKIYTRKLKFDYTKNEQKRLVFSLDYTDFEKGNYDMKLYHNGVLIGETSKALS
jgi:predicted  nucleic acid-binding Zn-ribbon protein